MTQQNPNPESVQGSTSEPAVTQCQRSNRMEYCKGARRGPHGKMARMLILGAAVALGVGIGSKHAQAQSWHGGLAMMGGGAHFMMNAERGAGMGTYKLERMFKAVEASEAQRTKIREIFKAASEEVRQLHDGQSEQGKKFMQLFAAATLDKAALEQARATQAAQHDKISRRMHQAMVEAAEVLTPEQRAKLGKALEERMPDDRGPRHGHRR